MSVKLLSEINDRYCTAIAVHRELSDVFWFIYMPGYAMLNEYQYIEESQTQRRVKRYITSTYHVYVPDNLPRNANIAEPLLKGRNRKDMESKQTCEIIRNAFMAYKKWEEDTLSEYERIARELFSHGEISAFNFVGDIIKDVKSELVYATDKIIELNSHNWDMTVIIAEQENYYERYSHLINKIFSENKTVSKLHHYNSGIDSQTRWAESYV